MKIKKAIAPPLTIALFAVGGLLLGDHLCDSYNLKKGIPPGFYLQCNSDGKYRPCYDSGTVLTWRQGSGSKAKAIRRAWGQYDFELDLHPREAEQNNWKRCD